MEVPEPRTVSLKWNGGHLQSAGTSRSGAQLSRPPGGSLRARLGLDLRRLRRNRLIDLQKGHLHLPRRSISRVSSSGARLPFGLFVQGVEHVDQFARSFWINHRLAGARIRVSARTMAALAASMRTRFSNAGNRAGNSAGGTAAGAVSGSAGASGAHRGLAFGFAPCFFHYFFAQLALGGKRAPVNDAERLFLFLFRTKDIP